MKNDIYQLGLFDLLLSNIKDNEEVQSKNYYIYSDDFKEMSNIYENFPGDNDIINISDYTFQVCYDENIFNTFPNDRFLFFGTIIYQFLNDNGKNVRDVFNTTIYYKEV